MSQDLVEKSYLQAVSREEATVFEWGSIQWLVSGLINEGSNMTVGYVEIEPGCKNPRHLHPNCDEVLYLMAGELVHSLGDEHHELRPGMSIFIPQAVAHDAVNTSTVTAKMIVTYSTGDRQTVTLEDGEEA